MRCRHVFAIATVFTFVLSMAAVAEARCGGCKRKGGASSTSQASGSCCSVGSPIQASTTSSSCCSKGVQNAPAKSAAAVDTSSPCKYCGMNCQHYAKSRMLIEYDGIPAQATCSLHCAASELASAKNRRLKSIQVGDFATSEMINADKAHWVIGGSQPGVMTMTATWAFNKRIDAETFIKNNGGKLGDFNDAIDAIYEDLKSTTKMIKIGQVTTQAQ